MQLITRVWWPLLATVGFACSGGNSTGAGGAGGQGVGGGDCLSDLPEAANAEFCADTPGNFDCSLLNPAAKVKLCGVPLMEPEAELARSSNVQEFSGEGPPQTACFASAPPTPGESTTVRIEGFARIFSGGCDSHDLKITFHRVEADGQLGPALGNSVVTTSTCKKVGEQSDTEDCVDGRWECSYAYEGIPTEVELAVRTENGPGASIWTPLVQYNVYVSNDDVVDGMWSHDVRALASGDYSVIPQAAIGRPITAGNGAIAGEVHDCGDVRLSNAVVDIDREHAITTYFTSNEDSPLPETGAKGTSVLGLYASLDVPPGPATVAAVGLVDGEVVSLGQHRVYVYPDTVTSLTFKGLRPYQ